MLNVAQYILLSLVYCLFMIERHVAYCATLTQDFFNSILFCCSDAFLFYIYLSLDFVGFHATHSFIYIHNNTKTEIQWIYKIIVLTET